MDFNEPETKNVMVFNLVLCHQERNLDQLLK